MSGLKLYIARKMLYLELYNGLFTTNNPPPAHLDQAQVWVFRETGKGQKLSLIWNAIRKWILGF